MAEKKKYTRKLKTLELEIESPEGLMQNYTLKELNGDQRDEYLEQINARRDKEGKEIGKVKGATADLLCRCLYGPDDKLVTAKTIGEFPSEMQLDLFKDAISLSGLDKEAKEQAKKT